MAWITFEIGGSVKKDVLLKVAETAKPSFSRDSKPKLGQLYFYAPRNFDAGAFPVHVKLDDDVKHFIVQGDMDIESAEAIERLLRRRKIDFNRWDDAFDEFNPTLLVVRNGQEKVYQTNLRGDEVVLTASEIRRQLKNGNPDKLLELVSPEPLPELNVVE